LAVRSKLIVLAGTTLLAGCAQHTWQGGDGTPLHIAEARCAMEAERVAPTYGSGSVFAIAAQQLRMEHLCMTSMGFYRVRSQ
jgi:hypothetical protein